MKTNHSSFKTVLFTLICCFFSLQLFAQYQLTIDAFALSEGTDEAVPFANLELTDGRLKSVANAEGQLILSFDERILRATDSFKISSLNFKEQKVHALTFLKFLRNTNKIYLKPLSKINEGPVLTGVVKAGDVPLQGSKIAVRGTNKITYTNSNGEFSVRAEAGDELLISAFGMKPQLIMTDSNQPIRVELEPDGELLRQVYLEGKGVQAYKYDLGINGKKTFDQITYSANLIGEDQNKPNYYRIQDFLQGRASKLNYTRNASLFNDAGVIVDLDGMIYAGPEAAGATSILNTIDPQNIKSISVLNSLTATHKYGTLGRGGVIVIRTKIMTGDPVVAEETRSAFVKGNDYTEGYLDEVPDEFQSYSQSDSGTVTQQLQEAIRLQLSKTDPSDADAYFGTANNYLNKDREFSMTVLSDFALANDSNPDMLRLLGMKYETLEEFEKAREVFQRVMVLSPQRAQSYLDLAQIYEKTGLYKESFELYERMFFNKIEGLDFTRLGDILADEIEHFLSKHRQEVDYSRIPNDLRRAKFNINTRVVFEWLDPYREFELQFVDPRGKYFIWMNNNIDNAEFMEAATRNGFSTEAFVIDEPFKNNWLVNILQQSSTNSNPMYLKYTIYKNYGSDQETSESKLISFEQPGKKYRLATLR